MDFIKEFNAVKSVFEYIDKHVKPFSKIYHRGGNEAVLNEMLTRLRKALTETGLLDAHTEAPLEAAYPVLRKIVMFILVNVDSNYKYDLRENEHIGHLVGIMPALPKCILFDILWELHLDQFLFEALAYTPCWFSFGFFDTISSSLKFIDDAFVILEKVEQLLRALNINLARSEMGRVSVVERVNIYKRLYEYSINILRQFYTPDAQSLPNFKKKQLIRYSALAIKHILQIAIHAIDVYESSAAAEPEIDITPYGLDQQVGLAKVPKSIELKDQQLQIIKVVLNSLHYNLERVNINTFMDWCELEDANKMNMQISIGILAFDLLKRLKADSELASADFIWKLEQFAISPESMKKMLKEVGIGEILIALEVETQKERMEQWFNELLNRTEVMFNEECQEAVKNNIELMNASHCKTLIDTIASYDAMTAEKKEAVLEDGVLEAFAGLVVLALNNLKTEEIAELLCYQANLLKVHTEVFSQSDNFYQRFTLFLNKYNLDSTFDMRQFLILCFENPKEAWERFFSVATQNETHIKNFCAVMRATPSFSNEFIFVLLQDAIEDEYKSAAKYFPDFLCAIYFALPAEERLPSLIQKFMHKNINTFLEEKDFHLITPLIKSLRKITEYEAGNRRKVMQFGDMTAPVLMMVGRTLDKARWDLLTYNSKREQLVNECIDFIRDTTKIFLPVATEKARMWLSKSFKDAYLPTTRYYFRKYPLAKHQRETKFVEFINTSKMDLKQPSEATKFLLQHLVQCTMKETEWLANEPELLPCIPNALSRLCDIAVEANDTNAFECYFQCLANCANVCRLLILPNIAEKTAEFEQIVVDIFSIILKSETTILFEQTFATLDHLVLEMIEKLNQQVPEAVVTKFRVFLARTNDVRCTQLFREKFEELLLKNAN